MTPPPTPPDATRPDAQAEPTPLVRRLLRLRLWMSDTLRLRDLHVLLLWAAAIGLAGAGAAHLFKLALQAVWEALLGGAAPLPSAFARLAWWQRVALPCVGGGVAGLFLVWIARLRREEQESDYMEAILIGDGRIALRSSLLRVASAFASSASGASIGREGPMVQLAATLASLPGRLLRISVPMRRQLVACGAAAGIASAYNAPIAGAFFVAEIVLGSLAMESFGPLVVSSVAATLATRALQGTAALYRTPPFALASNWEIVPYALLGLLAGSCAVVYLRFLRSSEQTFRVLPLPRAPRMMLGGAVVGLLATLHPEVCGNGYSVVDAILHDDWPWKTLLVVGLFKAVATAVTFGSGAVGGVFTPTLLVGGAVGYAFGIGIERLVPYAGFDAHAYALVGMGAFLAGATGAPVMAIVMLFELTLNYEIMLPLMLACVLSYTVCRSFERRFLYGDPAEREGERAVAGRLDNARVAALMRPDPLRVGLAAPFQSVAETFLQNRFVNLYVVDAEGRFRGAINLHDVKAYLDDPELMRVLIAQDIAREDFPVVTLDHPLHEVLRAFESHQLERLPVLDSHQTGRLVGSLNKTDLLLHLAGRNPTNLLARTNAPG